MMSSGSLRLMALGLTLMLAGGCLAGASGTDKHLRPLSYATQSALKSKNMRQEDPILIRIFKEESELEVWKKSGDGRYAHFRTYDICAWSGELGPKYREGDRQAPEGFYTVTPAQMNPNSNYHLSFNIGFPNTFDRAHGRTGSHLMVHGDCTSAGCFAMTDPVIEEIYALARESFRGGQREFQVQAFPFRMTPENMARHADNPNMPFWRNLKDGNDHFEVTGLAPEVAVCDRQYVFNASSAEPGRRLVPNAACPRLDIPSHIEEAVAAKQMRDETRFQVALAELRGRQPAQMSSVMVAYEEGMEEGSALGYESADADAAPAPVTGATAFNPVGAVSSVWGRLRDLTRPGFASPGAAAGAPATRGAGCAAPAAAGVVLNSHGPRH
jgi:murein L,D-transpeptidase YafK